MVPVVVNTPESMLRVKVLAIKEDREQTLKTLHKVGALHIDTGNELTPVDRVLIETERDRVTFLLGRVNGLLSHARDTEAVSPGEDIEVIYTRPLDDLEKEVDSLYAGLNNLYEKTLTPAETLSRLEELSTYLKPLSHDSTLTLNDLNFTGSYLFSRTIVFSDETYRNYEDRIGELFLEKMNMPVENEVVVYGIGRIENLVHVDTLIAGIEGRMLPVPEEDTLLADFIRESSVTIEGLRKELSVLLDDLAARTGENLERLVLLREVLVAERERLGVLEKAAESKYLVMVTGWVPKSLVDSAIAELKDSIGDVYVDTREPEAEEEPPSKLKNRGGFRPFEIIINLFGTPKYREWDPTPIISYSFALFFGLMICDVVYAIGVMLLGRFLLSKFVDDPQTENFRNFQKLIYICSGVALVGGLLTGQYLGDIHTLFGIGDLALSQAVKETLQDPVSFIVIALVIGFVHVNIAHILGFVQGIKNREKWVVVAKVGLFLLQFAIPGLLNSLLGVDIPFLSASMYSIFNYLMLGGLVLIVISSFGTSGGLGAIMWLFDVTGLLGDIMSYARLAGVGLATYYLASTFNMMSGLFAEMMPGPVGAVIGSIIGIVIVIFGHLINVVLGAISGFIHSLRLCFVEFLFKFYEGGGELYSPFRIKKKSTLPVTAKS